MEDSLKCAQEPLKVVAVDDDQADLVLLEHHLSHFTDPVVHFQGFTDPEVALAELPGARPDVLLIDFSMRSSTGIEFLRRVRDAGVTAPAILLTGRGDEETVMRAIHAGFGDYLAKSVWSGRSLHRSITNVIEKHRLAERAKEYLARLEETNRHLEARNKEVSNFYHTLAHELRTPLTGAREFVTIVLDGLTGPVNDDQRDLLESAVSSCDQLRRCIDDLFDVSRLETGKLEVIKRPGRLHETVLRAVRCVLPKANERGIRLISEELTTLPELEMDEQRIEQVITNLVGNAVKFTESGGEVVVRLEVGETGEQRVSVRDTGVGIASDELDLVFDRLYQTEGNAAVRGGMGLGLHLCRELVRRHDGEISVESELGRGSTFAFWLPSPAQPVPD